MASGRQVTKIKAAGDISVDYTVPVGKIANVSIITQGLGENGGGALLLKDAGIPQSMVIDTEREAYASPALGPGLDVRRFNVNLLFSKEKISKDNGATWMYPREEGGQFIRCNLIYSTRFDLGIFEWQPSIGLLYLSMTDFSIQHTVNMTASTTTNDRFKHEMLNSEFIEAVLMGANGISGFQVIFDTVHLRSQVNLPAIGGSGTLIDTVYEYDGSYAASFNLIPNKSVAYNGGANDNSANIFAFVPLDGTFVKMYMLTTGTALLAPIAISSIDNISDVLFSYTTNGSSGVIFFISKYDQELRYSTTSQLYTLALTTAVPTTTGQYHANWDDEEMIFAYQEDGGDYTIVTDKGRYSSATANGTWSMIQSFEPVESNVVAVSDTYGLSGSKYISTSEMDATDWLGVVLPTVALTNTTDAEHFVSSSLGATVTNVLKLAPIEVPLTTVAVEPAELSGILLSTGDQLIVVGDVDTNLTIMSVEQ